MNISDKQFEELAKTMLMISERVEKETGHAVGVQFCIMETEGQTRGFRNGYAISSKCDMNQFTMIMDMFNTELKNNQSENDRPEPQSGETEKA